MTSSYLASARLNRFEVVVDPRRPRAVRFRLVGGGGLYRIDRPPARGYRLESAPSG